MSLTPIETSQRRLESFFNGNLALPEAGRLEKRQSLPRGRLVGEDSPNRNVL